MALAAAVAHRPRLLLLDEPEVGLDLEGRRRVEALIKALKREGAAVVVATHEIWGGSHLGRPVRHSRRRERERRHRHGEGLSAHDMERLFPYLWDGELLATLRREAGRSGWELPDPYLATDDFLAALIELAGAPRRQANVGTGDSRMMQTRRSGHRDPGVLCGMAGTILSIEHWSDAALATLSFALVVFWAYPVRSRALLARLVPFLIFAGITFAFGSLGEGTSLTGRSGGTGEAAVSRAGLAAARMILIGVASGWLGLYVGTTRMISLLAGLGKVGRRFGLDLSVPMLAMGVAIRFLPLVEEEARRLQMAWEARARAGEARAAPADPVRLGSDGTLDGRCTASGGGIGRRHRSEAGRLVSSRRGSLAHSRRGGKRPAPRGTGAPQVDRAHGCMVIGRAAGLAMGGMINAKFAVTVAYDGTDYHGFQDQGREDCPTIQRALATAGRGW